MRTKEEDLKKFSNLRKFSMSTIMEAEIFYIDKEVEMVIPEFLDRVEEFGVISRGNSRPILSQRWGIPIKDIDGGVIGVVGYGFGRDERYIYSTGDYYRRRDTLYGMENMKYAIDEGIAIVTEGITDCIALRNIGIKNSFALCGTHRSKVVERILNRVKVIHIPDRDKPGEKAQLKYQSKFNGEKGDIGIKNRIVLYVPLGFKDVDDAIKESKEMKSKIIEAILDCSNKLNNGVSNERVTIFR